MGKICPHCKAEIEYLDWLHTEFVHDRLDPGGCVSNVNSEGADDIPEKFECPLCDALIAENMSDAMDFLDAEDEGGDSDEQVPVMHGADRHADDNSHPEDGV